MYTKRWACCTTGIVSFLAMPDSCLKLLWNFLKMSKTWIIVIIIQSQHVWWDNLAKEGAKILLKLNADSIRINLANYLNGCWIKQTGNSPENFWIQVLGIYWRLWPCKFTFLRPPTCPKHFSCTNSEVCQQRSYLLNFWAVAKNGGVLPGIKLESFKSCPLSMQGLSIVAINVWHRSDLYWQISDASCMLAGLKWWICIVNTLCLNNKTTSSYFAETEFCNEFWNE